MNDLEKARKEINKIDREMAKLFEQRMDAVKAVARYKKECGLQVFDKTREDEIIKKNAELIRDEELKPYYVNYIRRNMEISRAFQHKLLEGMRVAYAGVPGAFAEVAAKKVFPDATAVPYHDFASAYNAAVDGECECVILPVENSYNGDVGQVMDLTFFGSLYINGIYDIEVVQNLLAVKGAKIDDIKQVISHPQALGQCSKYIREHGFEAIEASNTAVAAKRVADSARLDVAAIGSEQAARQYGLEVLATNINQSSKNTTRFAVFSRTPKTQTAHDNQFIMVFTVKNEAGSLGKAISVIGKNGFNLRALKSRPTKELVWSYYFYAEGEGNINTEKGRKMLEELPEACDNLRIVGSFEKEIML